MINAGGKECFMFLGKKGNKENKLLHYNYRFGVSLKQPAIGLV